VDNTQNIISFCTGYGGLELGLRIAGVDVRTVAYVEVEAFAAANLVAKMEENKLDAAPVWTDIRTFPAEKFRGRVDIIMGGFPCQPFSAAGRRKGAEDERHLWPYILEHIRTIRPVWCFFENVGGHLSLGFDEVLKSLRDLGYKVEAGLFTAAEVGAPHKRERLFILARLDDPGGGAVGSYGKDVGAASGEVHKTTGTGVLRTEELADTGRFGRRRRYNGEPAGQGRPLQAEGSGELADAPAQRIQGNEPAGNDKPERQIDQLRYHRWPARPGQEQYEWEEPRTVKPGMGRTVDGFASRVDELRLLGNGVVPQQAALAWSELISKF